jgi:oligopeptide/dipeptide ABC transporter ATP-binding protein
MTVAEALLISSLSFPRLMAKRPKKKQPLVKKNPEIPKEHLVEIRSLKKYFETKRGIFAQEKKWVHAVDDVNFYIRRGEVFGLVGESGCGKTTVGKLIIGLIRPTVGEIYFDGHDLTEFNKEEMRKLRRRMGIIYQHPSSSLNPRMTIHTILSRPIDIHKIAKGEKKEELILKVLEEVGLEPRHLDRYPHEFSGGQQQRIAIGRVLVLNPDFVVLDEPTSALDVSVQAHILNMLGKLQSKFGFTYLLISHDLNIVEHMSDRIAVMYVGKMVELADKAELNRNALHPYTRSLLAVAPIADPKRKRKGVILKGEVPSTINPPPGCRFHPRCPYAKPVCKEKEPAFRGVGGGHYVACHFVKSRTHKWPSPRK